MRFASTRGRSCYIIERLEIIAGRKGMYFLPCQSQLMSIALPSLFLPSLGKDWMAMTTKFVRNQSGSQLLRVLLLLGAGLNLPLPSYPCGPMLFAAMVAEMSASKRVQMACVYTPTSQSWKLKLIISCLSVALCFISGPGYKRTTLRIVDFSVSHVRAKNSEA